MVIADAASTPSWTSQNELSGRRCHSTDVLHLAWKALGAIASTCTATLGAYGIGAGVLGQLSAKRGTIALAVAAVTLITVTVGAVRHRRSIPARQKKRPI
jgi:hypothetical protein